MAAISMYRRQKKNPGGNFPGMETVELFAGPDELVCHKVTYKTDCSIFQSFFLLRIFASNKIVPKFLFEPIRINASRFVHPVGVCEASGCKKLQQNREILKGGES